MAKSLAKRPVIAPGRVDAALHQEVKSAAEASGRSMAEELTELARGAIAQRRRFPNPSTAQAFEMFTLGFLIGGERAARGRELSDWSADLECRREAALNACATLITQFVSNDPAEQAITVEALKGRIWRHIVTRPGADVADIVNQVRGEGKS